MKARVNKHIVLLASILLIVACQSKETVAPEKRKTINIQGANSDIKNSVGIDLLKYKSKIDRQFSSDSFYVELCEDILFYTGESKIYNEFGPTVTYDNGDSIQYLQRDSLITTIFHCIGNNFYLDDCKGSSKDSAFCNMKIQASENLQSINWTYTLTAINTFGDLYDTFKKGYLNYDELSYMVIVHHLIRDIYSLEK